MNGLDFRRAVHESSHVVAALATGGAVYWTTFTCGGGGRSSIVFDAAALQPAVVACLAGHEGEQAILGTADSSRSAFDDDLAFRGAYLIATEEEHAAATKTDMPPAVVRLSTFSEADIEAGKERLRARRTARAHVLVREARPEARALIDQNRCVVRLIATRLAQVDVLGKEELLSLFEEGRRRQDFDDRRTRRTA